MQPLVTVLTLCHNHGPYLQDYFRGLLSQSYRNIELILMDDCSNDSSWNIIESHRPLLGRSFPRVICQRSETNLGFFGALRQARGHITGTLLCFLDGDDFFYPSRIAKNVAFLAENPAVGVVHSDVDFLFVETGRLERGWWKKSFTPPQGRVFEKLVLGNYVTTCTICCRGDLFNRYVDFDRYEAAGYKMADHPMLLDLALNTEFGYIDEPLACYRVLPASASHFTDPARLLAFRLSGFQVCLDYIDRYGLPESTKDVILRQRSKFLFEYGYMLGLGDVCWEGYSWLRERFPDEYATLPNRLRALASRNRALYRVSRWWRAVRSPADPPGGPIA